MAVFRDYSSYSLCRSNLDIGRNYGVVFLIKEAISSSNYNPAVNIITWVLMVSMVLSACTKVAMKVVAYHSFDTDDALLAAAMVIFPLTWLLIMSAI